MSLNILQVYKLYFITNLSGKDAGFVLGRPERLGGGTNLLYCQNIPHPHENKEFLVRGEPEIFCGDVFLRVEQMHKIKLLH